MALTGCVFDMRNLLLLAGFSILFSCGRDHEEADISKVSRSAEFQRFDLAFFGTDTAGFENKLPELAAEYPEFFAGGMNPIFWKAQRKDEIQNELYRKSREMFSDFAPLNENLNFSMKHYYYYFPASPQIKFYAYISNLDFDYPVLFADSVCFVALDMYLGPGQPYYQQLPQYVAFFRQPAFLIRDVMYEIVKTRVPQFNPGGSLLDAMIHHGKILYATEQMMPQSE